MKKYGPKTRNRKDWRNKDSLYDIVQRPNGWPGVTGQPVRWSGCTAWPTWGKQEWRRRQTPGDSVCSSELKQRQSVCVCVCVRGFIFYITPSHALLITASLLENASQTVNSKMHLHFWGQILLFICFQLFFFLGEHAVHKNKQSHRSIYKWPTTDHIVKV